MDYRKPDEVLGEEKYSSYYKRAKDTNNFGAAWKFEDRLLSDRDNFIYEVERTLNYYEDQKYEDQEKRLETQQSLMIEELGEIFKVIEEYYVVTAEDGQCILLVIYEIAKNAFDHAKSDLHAKFEFSKIQQGILFTFILADKGPGIKQYLIDLFNNEEFMSKFKNKNEHSGEVAEKVFQLLDGGEIDEVYKMYIGGKGLSTGSQHNDGNFFERIIKSAVDDAGLDLIFRDDEYEHTFSNKMGYIGHETIKKLPYKLVYQGAKLFPNKTE